MFGRFPTTTPTRIFINSTLSNQIRQVSLIPRVAVQAIKENLGKPKQGINGYSLYYQEKYVPNFGILDIARRVGSAWKSSSPVDQQKYKDRAAKLSEQSKVDTASYQESLTSRQKVARKAIFYNTRYSKGKVTRAEVPKEVKKFIKGMPSAPFSNGRAMFLAAKLRGQKDSIKLMSTVSAEWTRLSAQEKKIFEDRAAADIKAYVQNLNKYIKI